MSTSAPQCVGIIMDGNRRWARSQGLPGVEGHRKGAETLKEVVRAANEKGIKHVFFYTLSTENWKREQQELDFLFGLIEELFRSYVAEAKRDGVRMRVAGERTRFSDKLQKIFDEVEEETMGNDKMTVWFGLSYGGRHEIVEATNRAIAAGVPVTEESFNQHLWTADLPDPDIIIRTGGERRLSNFLSWSSVYSELFFVDTQWPAFTRDQFFAILDEYQTRERRMGK